MFTAIKLFFGSFGFASIKNYALIGLVIALGLMSLLYQLEKTRHRATTSEYAAFVAKTSALGEIQQAKNKEIEARQELITKTIVNSYEESLQQLEAHYEANPNLKYITLNRVQDANTSSGGMSTSTESTKRANTGFEGNEKATSSRGSEEIQIDGEKASKEIVQCLELINWNKSNN